MRTLLCCCLFCLPLKNLHLTSDFGMRYHPVDKKMMRHQGIDLRASADTAYAIADGYVLGTGYHPKLGRWLRIRHHTVVTEYGHLRKLLVSGGDSVNACTAVAVTGATGSVTAEHLHFSVYFNGRALNPTKFLYQLIKRNHEQKLQTAARANSK